jgi:hypothetical protein
MSMIKLSAIDLSSAVRLTFSGDQKASAIGTANETLASAVRKVMAMTPEQRASAMIHLSPTQTEVVGRSPLIAADIEAIAATPRFLKDVS